MTVSFFARRLALLAALAALAIPAEVAAQPAPGAPSVAAAPVSATAPIGVREILARADEDLQRVDAARQLLAGPQPFERLRGELEAIAMPVTLKLRTATGAGLRELPIMRLESLARHWAFDSRR